MNDEWSDDAKSSCRHKRSNLSNIRSHTPPRYAIMFKTHFWDAFAERQLNRLIEASRSGDVFVVFDGTRGHVPNIGHANLFLVTEQGAAHIGLPPASTDRSVFWYNIDYAHYLFFLANGEYDYYVAVEYDVSLQTDVDSLVSELANQQIDYLGSPIKEPSRWPWSRYHAAIYKPEEMRIGLSCFSVYSRRAIALLLERRLAMADEFKNGTLAFWPNNEAFIPTEIRRANFESASLQRFGSISAYDWWPPMHESELQNHPGETFIHPVLEGDRYVRSILRHERHLFSCFVPRSRLRRRLAREGDRSFIWAVGREVWQRGLRYVERKLEDARLKRHWTANAWGKGRKAAL